MYGVEGFLKFGIPIFHTVKPLITNTSEEFINLFKKFIKNSPMINIISKLTVRANEQLG